MTTRQPWQLLPGANDPRTANSYRSVLPDEIEINDMSLAIRVRKTEPSFIAAGSSERLRFGCLARLLRHVLVAEALLLSKGLAYSKHSAVIAGFGKEFAKEGVLPAELHAHLREASDARNVADYQAESDLTKEATVMHISRAERFVAVGEEILRRT